MALNKWRIKRKIGSLSKNLPIIVYKTIDSTNTRAKLSAESGEYKSAVFMSSEQTAGRGRLGRSFISERGKGLYTSMLVGGRLSPDYATSLTTYMAVIASRVIERLSGVEARIKWVNDIYVGGKKVSGILTEAKTTEDSSALEYAVVGIGINLLKQDFDREVKNIATTIEDESGKKININTLAAMLIKEFFEGLHTAGSKEIADEYKSRSFLIGERVTVIKPNESYEALVTDITDKCELMLTLSDGSTEPLRTGEVSVRKI